MENILVVLWSTLKVYPYFHPYSSSLQFIPTLRCIFPNTIVPLSQTLVSRMFHRASFFKTMWNILSWKLSQDTRAHFVYRFLGKFCTYEYFIFTRRPLLFKCIEYYLTGLTLRFHQRHSLYLFDDITIWSRTVFESMQFRGTHKVLEKQVTNYIASSSRSICRRDADTRMQTCGTCKQRQTHMRKTSNYWAGE